MSYLTGLAKEPYNRTDFLLMQDKKIIQNIFC